MTDDTQKFDLAEIGKNLFQSRKTKYPNDTMEAFATRCEIGLSTYKKMEKGDLSVGLHQYYKAARILNLESSFNSLLKTQEDWFND